MWFLLRATFWISLVLLLVPMDTGTVSKSHHVSPLEALGVAQAAMQDAKGFCERNPAACETGAAALVTVGEKARVGVRMLNTYLDENLPSDGQATARPAATNPTAPLTTSSIPAVDATALAITVPLPRAPFVPAATSGAA
jgi:Family of unknown function (DUF5330)